MAPMNLREQFKKEKNIIGDVIPVEDNYNDLYIEWLENRKCLNANREIGICIERAIVSRIKAGEKVYEVLDDYGIKYRK